MATPLEGSDAVNAWQAKTKAAATQAAPRAEDRGVVGHLLDGLSASKRTIKIHGPIATRNRRSSRNSMRAWAADGIAPDASGQTLIAAGPPAVVRFAVEVEAMNATTVEQLLARFGSGIESTPGVCGGDPRIAGTRIPVWTLEQYRRRGMTEAQLLASYPGLRAADLVNAWAYVAAHPDEIDELIRENEEA
jgi:uncharacterized protein (DUF433 family)